MLIMWETGRVIGGGEGWSKTHPSIKLYAMFFLDNREEITM